jgi:hypothetical protein
MATILGCTIIFVAITSVEIIIDMAWTYYFSFIDVIVIIDFINRIFNFITLTNYLHDDLPTNSKDIPLPNNFLNLDFNYLNRSHFHLPIPWINVIITGTIAEV